MKEENSGLEFEVNAGYIHHIVGVMKKGSEKKRSFFSMWPTVTNVFWVTPGLYQKLWESRRNPI
ncbi:hypothetical protein SFC43_13635 [Bacteroides sp. CR5/BHMF/2]|nr:hypothetical protein [Bacteroides sp. CR5/BHMF/2]